MILLQLVDVVEVRNLHIRIMYSAYSHWCFQDAVIAFVLRVLPSVMENFSAPTFSSCLLSSPVILISLLGVVDTHIYEYADFTLQRSFYHVSLHQTVSYQLPVRMVAIYQLLRDSEQIRILFSMLSASHATPQPLSPGIDPSWWYTVGGMALIPSLTQCTITAPQLPTLASPSPTVDFVIPAWPNMRSPLQDPSSALHSSLSAAKTSLQKLSLPNVSRSYSSPDIQVALLADVISTSVQGSPSTQSHHSPHIKQVGIRNIVPKTPSPSLFTPDPTVAIPTMEADPLMSLATPDLLRLHQTSSSPLLELPHSQAQPASPVSSQAFIILDDPFYNTFLTAIETVSSKRKLESTLDSSPARRMRNSTHNDYTDTTNNLVATEDDKPTVVIKTRGRAKNRVVSDNIHTIANKVKRKRAVSMRMMNKENHELEG